MGNSTICCRIGICADAGRPEAVNWMDSDSATDV